MELQCKRGCTRLQSIDEDNGRFKCIKCGYYYQFAVSPITGYIENQCKNALTIKLLNNNKSKLIFPLHCHKKKDTIMTFKNKLFGDFTINIFDDNSIASCYDDNSKKIFHMRDTIVDSLDTNRITITFHNNNVQLFPLPLNTLVSSGETIIAQIKLVNTPNLYFKLNSVDDKEYKNRLKICEDENPLNPEHFHKLNFNEPYNLSIGTTITVFDDSKLCGGTKSRFLSTVLRQPRFIKYREYIYVSSPYGGAQIALAVAIRQINTDTKGGETKRAIIFVDKQQEHEPAPFVKILKYIKVITDKTALENKTELDWIEIYYETDPKKAAINYQKLSTERILLNPGFNYEETLEEIKELGDRIKKYRKEQGKKIPFDEIWVATGSGTLVTGLQRSEGLGIDFFAVTVIGETKNVGNANRIRHYRKQKFEIPVSDENAPPFLSASRYDAKVWEHVKNRENAGNILVWNVM